MTPRRVLAPLVLLAAVACSSSSSPAAKPSPTLPPVATDTAAVTASLITAAELGAPWVEPKKVNQTDLGKGELCPGHPDNTTIEKPRAYVRRSLTEGTKAGAAIAAFNVYAYDPARFDAWRAAIATEERTCAGWKAAEGNYVVLTPLTTPPAVAGADEVIASVQRVYADAAHKTLQYVRHVLLARTGRCLSRIELAFVQPKTDPNGEDTSKAVGLLEKQVAKTKTTCGG